MSSSRLSKDAYNQGYLNKKEFRVWLDAQKRAENMAPSFAKELQRQFEQGRSDRLEHEAAKRLALLKEKKADSPKAPPTPKGQKPADQNEDYRGRTIRRTQAGFEVLGTTWNNIKQAKEYVDIMEATGGRAYLKKSNRKRNAKGSKLRTKIARTRKVVEKRVTAAAKALKGNRGLVNPISRCRVTFTQGQRMPRVTESRIDHWIPRGADTTGYNAWDYIDVSPNDRFSTAADARRALKEGHRGKDRDGINAIFKVVAARTQ